MEPKNSDHLEYKHGALAFQIRAKATRGDQYEMNAFSSESMDIQDGKVIKTRPARLYPWLIERFVTGWNHPAPWSLKALMDLPAEPGEDLVLILGSYILNHTGLIPSDTLKDKKKA